MADDKTEEPTVLAPPEKPDRQRSVRTERGTVDVVFAVEHGYATIQFVPTVCRQHGFIASIGFHDRALLTQCQNVIDAEPECLAAELRELADNLHLWFPDQTPDRMLDAMRTPCKDQPT